MKKKISLILVMVLSMSFLAGCRYDTPFEMMGVYIDARKKSNNALDAFGKYCAAYGWNYFMIEEASHNMSWEEACNYPCIKKLPKLVNTIDTIEPYVEDYIVLHIKDSSGDFKQAANDYALTLKNNGFNCTVLDEDKKSVSIVMENDYEVVRIYGKPQKYEQSHNIQITVKTKD